MDILSMGDAFCNFKIRDELMMYISGIDWESVIDGIGVRIVIFVSGCNHHCNGCHNMETWNYTYGALFDKKIEDKIIENSRVKYIRGITLSGGCPMCNAKSLIPFVIKYKNTFPNKNIWCYCGEIYEDIIKDKYKKKLLNLIDVLVDGKFDISKRDTTLAFRGSSNQRIIDVKKSKNKIVLLDL